jgi:Bacteriophage tail sheath protein
MPSQLTYPGVYVEEIPSGVRTIAGVATSIGAFIGWLPKGSTARPELVLSFADFERKCGGLSHPKSLVAYAVYHFFLNGGQQAYVLRLAAEDAAVAEATVSGLPFKASSPGKWSNDYTVAITPASAGDRFKVEVQRSKRDGVLLDPKLTVEVFESLSVNPSDSRFAKAVINEESTLVELDVPDGAAAPAKGSDDLTNGADGDILEPGTPAFEGPLEENIRKAFDRVDLFNLMAVPGLSDKAVIEKLQAYCREQRAFFLADTSKDTTFDALNTSGIPAATDNAKNGALYFPWIKGPDPLQENRVRPFPPSGFVAGIMARTDATRGVWKAPAGIDASITGAVGLTQVLTDLENGQLNIKGANCLRQFPIYGSVVWGARTLQGNDEVGSEWKYVPVRRTALYIEESLFRGLKWVVFEPNDEPLWAQIRLNVGAFLNDLFRQGAFQGRTPRDAYFVKCDKDTTTQNDINRGIVNILVGFAPLKPAEFVVLKLQQMAGQIQV